MKTAISIPDAIFESADELAARLGMSRSELYANAVEEFVAKHVGEDVTNRLNELYGREVSRVSEGAKRAQAKASRSSEW
ncbi:MAG: hypothetical protein ACYC0B_10380 [Gemmatimonadaceae bacterium]